MDPWADTSAAWSPTEVVRPVASPQISKGPSSPYHEGPADPWAEPSHVAASIPIVTSGSEHRRPSSDDDIPAGEEVPGGDFDPWGGNSAPLAPIAADLPTSTPIRPEDVDLSPRKDTSENRGWSEDSSKEEARDPRHGQVESFGEDMVVCDDDDPWGSGAAARHVKAQQEAEANMQRMEILRLQEEAKGKAADESDQAAEGESSAVEGKEEEQKAAEEASSGVATTALSGWRSLFSKATPKVNEAEVEQKREDGLKVDINVARNGGENNGSPRSSTTAPRLWQAPTILGTHTRSASSTSRADSVKEISSSTTATKGPGWEVTTKKQQAPGGGGLIQSLFGGSNNSSSGVDKSTVTTTQKVEKTGGLNRFGRGMQPPPITSAADDEEDDSFDTEETGIEWDSSNAFDETSKKRDLLSDEAEENPKESAVGKLLGRWRGTNATASAKPGDLSKNDLSWLESVGGQAGGSIEQGVVKSDSSDVDWLAFIDGKPDVAASNPKQETGAQRGISTRMSPSTSKASSISARIPILAPPPPSNSRNPAPFAFGASDTKTSISSTSRQTSDGNTTHLSYTDFDEPLVDSATSPNLDGSYRDDAADNDAALLKQRPGAPVRKTNSFLRNFQAKPSRSRYNYDEDAQDEPDNTWSAFRDDPTITSTRSATVYRDKPLQSSTQQPQQGTHSPRQQPASIPSPPPIVSQAPRTWDRNAPLLAPPGRPSSTGQQKQAFQSPPVAPSPPPSAKGTPKALSQGKTLTSDDLSFFESL